MRFPETTTGSMRSKDSMPISWSRRQPAPRFRRARTADLNLTSTDKHRIDRLLQRAQRLRELYGIQNANQRGPFFELQTKDFALIAIDTGIRRTVDDRQRAWIDEALKRASGKFTMAIVGHPKFAAGRRHKRGTMPNSRNSMPRSNAPACEVMMAGDTHAFEYYVGGVRRARHRASRPSFRQWRRRRLSQHWRRARLARRSFRPRPGPSIQAQKQSAPSWMPRRRPGSSRSGNGSSASAPGRSRSRRCRACSTSTSAPFYQSFMEVRVERSKNRVVFLLHGANGPVRWRDLHVSARWQLSGPPDEPVQFIVEMRSSPTPTR